jgi:hypothetical protein
VPRRQSEDVDIILSSLWHKGAQQLVSTGSPKQNPQATRNSGQKEIAIDQLFVRRAQVLASHAH